MSTTPMRLAVLGSGKGSNLQAIFDAIDGNQLHAEVICVISDVENAFILERARRRGVPAEYVDGAPFRTKLDGDAERRVIDLVRQHGGTHVALAGYMRMIKAGLLEAFTGRVFNIHPSLLPAFPGLEAWTQAVEAGARESGCTVHVVDPGMDTGAIILQRSVPVLPDDTPAVLHARIQQQEHVAYPEALQTIAEGRVGAPTG
jgi:phosphoribosylglycinamide formyltransferase-1